MSEMTPGSWPGLGAEGESMAATPQDAVPQAARDREATDATEALTLAVNGMAGQLKAVREELKAVREQLRVLGDRQDREAKLARRIRHLVIGLTVSLLIDVAVTVLVAVFAVKAQDASAQASATVAQLHSVQISSCRSGNQTRAGEVAFWEHIAAASITSRTTAAQRRTDAQLLAYVKRAFAPVNCSARYRLRS